MRPAGVGMVTSVERRAWVVVGALAVALALVHGFLFLAIRDLSALRHHEQDHRDFAAAVQELNLLVTEAEGDVRGYHITTDEQFREDYLRSKQRADDALAVLGEHPTGGSVSELVRLTHRRFELLDEALDLRDEQGMDAVAEFIRGEPSTLTNQVRILADAIIEESAIRADAEARSADRRAAFAGGAVLAASVAAFGLLLWIALLNRRRARQARDAEAALRHRFGAFAQAMPSASFSVFADYTIVDWNAAATNAFGVDPAAAIGADLRYLIPGDPGVRIVAALDEARSTGAAVDLELVVRPEGGPQVDLEGVAFPILGAEGPMMGAVLRDLTALHEVQRAEEATRGIMRLVVETSVEAIITVNRRGRILLFNPAAERYLRIPATEAVGRDLLEFIAGGDRAAVREALAGARRGGAASSQAPQLRIRARAFDGSEFPAEANVASLGDAGEATAAVTLRDLSDQERWERSLTEARLQAEAANLAKSQFLSRMSHELRTPMNVILGYSQLLELDEQATQEQKDSVGHIHKAGRHLLALIDEVLDLSRVEGGELSLSLEPVLLAELANESVAMIRPLAAANQVRFETDSDSCQYMVMADKQRIKQVLINLLSNAIKYNVPQGSVDLSCTHAGDGTVRLLVRDTGPGLSEAQQARIFQPFERLGAEFSPVPGTGLGLALCKRLVEAMSGRIGVTSEVGRGSTFWVDLPEAEDTFEPGPQSAPRAVLSPLSRGSIANVLYIEDNLSNFRVIEEVARRIGNIRLIPAMQGGLGLDLARESQPDLVLLDLDLPDMPGTEVLQALRGDPRTGSVPVVVITADASARQEERLLDAGAAAYLTKPVDLSALRATFARFLEEPA